MNITTVDLRRIIKEELYSLIKESTPSLSEAPNAIQSLGFTNVEFVASGQYGHVFKAIWQTRGNVPRAIKVMNNDANGQKEANIYKKVSDARAKSDEIAKHFPAVDMISVSQDKKLIMVVMELLESDPNTKPVIEDLFGFREVGSFRPDVSLEDLDIFKDVGYRANMMVIEPKSRIILIDYMAYSFPEEARDKLRNIILGMNFDNMIYPQDRFNKLKSLISKKSPALWDYMDVAEDDLAKTGTAAMSFLFYFIVYSIKGLIGSPHKISLIDILSELEFSVEHFIESYRNYTPIGIGGPTYPGAPKETEGLGYPGAKSLLKAIEDLKVYTGLEARDMHDRNVLVRPKTKDIVIVDVGLFKDIGPQSANIYERKLTKPEYKKKKQIAKAIEKDDPSMPDDQKYAIATATAKRVAEGDPKKGTGKKPKGSGRRLYTDENPSDTVSVKFSSVQDIKDTFSKASFKSKSHKRQSQIINLVHQRVRAAYQNAKDPEVKARLKKAFEYAKKRKEASKRKTKRMQKDK